MLIELDQVDSIVVESTPNPSALKFFPGGLVATKGMPNFFTAKSDLSGSPLATALLSVAGIESVFYGNDFITVTKSSEFNWNVLKPEIKLIVLAMYNENESVFIPSFQPSDKSDVNLPDVDIDPEVAEIVSDIKEIINDYIRPSILEDGGDIEFYKFEAGVVFLRMVGACASCPSADATLKLRIFNLLSAYIPEVLDVVAV